MLGVGGSLPVTEVTIRTRQLLFALSHAMLTEASQLSVKGTSPILLYSLFTFTRIKQEDVSQISMNLQIVD